MSAPPSRCRRPRPAPRAGSGTSGRCPRTRRRPASRSRRRRSWRPETATLARRNFSRRCSRAAFASSPGSSVRSSGAGRPDAAIRDRKISRISARLRWIAGTRMCEGRSSPSWTISSARSVSQAEMPSAASASLSPISWVTIDFTLTTSSTLVSPRDVGDDPAGLRGVAGPVHDGAMSGQGLLERLQLVVEVEQGPVLEVGARLPQLLPFGHLGDDTRALVPDRVGGVREVVPQLGVPQRLTSRDRERRHTDEGRGHAAPPSVAARISARCITRTPERWRDSSPPMCMQARAVPGDQHLRVGLAHVASLVGSHGDGDVGVLHREGPAEAAALLRAGQVDQRQPAHRLEQPPRAVADAEQPQRVAGRVVGDAMREGRTDVRRHRARRPGTRSARRRAARARRPPRPGPGHRIVGRRAGAGVAPSRRRIPTVSRSRRTPRMPTRRCGRPGRPRRGSRCSPSAGRSRSAPRGSRRRRPVARGA